jgi:von Willebrand factor type A domain
MRRASLTLFTLGCLAAACSSTVKERPSAVGSEPADAGPEGASVTDAASRSEAAPLGGGFIAPPAEASVEDDDAAAAPGACGTERRKAEATPVDMFIMMDRSGSMTETVNGGVKWDLLVSALRSFVEDPGSRGMGVGIQYFGLENTALGANVVTCTPSDYAVPDVAIGVLPGAVPALESSLAAHAPGGGTPTVPALEGALQYASAWVMQNPTHKVVVVLATDGEPNDCGSTVAGVSAAAAAGLSASPGIPTYVIGVGSALTDLDAVAAAGGTGRAFIVDTTQNVAQTFAQAMSAIRNAAALPCRFAIPESDGGRTQDLARLAVVYTPSTGADAGRPLPVARVASPAACDPAAGGWFYDDPTNPQVIELCGATCVSVAYDPAGEVDLLVGCQTQVTPIH